MAIEVCSLVKERATYAELGTTMALLEFGVTEPWDHQVEDFEKLKDQPHVLVGNDMGSGKTYLAGLLDAHRRKYADVQKTLVVSPLNTFGDEDFGWIKMWRTEFPHLKIRVIDPKARHLFLQEEADVYIMHSEALRLMPELITFGFDHVIADECQDFKTRDTKRTKALKKIKAPFRTAMSGSPATDHPHDLWSILNWLKPHEYSSFWRFYKQAVEYEIIYPQQFHKVIGPSRWWETVGLKQIEPWYVRRTKEQLMPNLPPKTYDVIKVRLEGKHRKAYDQMDADMIAWVGEHENEPIVAPVLIARLQRLQQLALAYLEYDEDKKTVRMTDPSPKIDAAFELIMQHPDEQFVVFSQFKAPLRMLSRRLEKEGVPCASYTGDDSKKDRDLAKSDFIKGKCRVFTSTIRAGGIGVDGLQWGCNKGIFLDRDWSPMKNLQAEDRLHRGGQVKSVQIIDIMAKNTVDAGRKQRIELKWDWVKRMLGDKKRED